MLGIVWNDLICSPFICKESTFMSYMKLGKIFPQLEAPLFPGCVQDFLKDFYFEHEMSNTSL